MPLYLARILKGSLALYSIRYPGQRSSGIPQPPPLRILWIHSTVSLPHRLLTRLSPLLANVYDMQKQNIPRRSISAPQIVYGLELSLNGTLTIPTAQRVVRLPTCLSINTGTACHSMINQPGSDLAIETYERVAGLQLVGVDRHEDAVYYRNDSVSPMPWMVP